MIALVRTTAQELPVLHKTPNFSILVKKESVYIGLINKKPKEDQFVSLSQEDRKDKSFFSVKCLHLLLHHVGEMSHIP